MIYKWQVHRKDPHKLGSFLYKYGFSRTQLKQLKFHGGMVFVNHKQRQFSYPVHPADEVIVVLPTETGSDKIVPMHHSLDIVYEDNNYLIVNKPPHLASLPDKVHKSASLANYVKAYLQDTNSENDAIHLVSRLDRDTSGIITFAKNSYAHSVLAGEFRTDKVTKEYYAIVSGNFTESKLRGLIDEPIGVNAQNHNLRCVKLDGKPSQTRYRVIKQFDDYSLVKIRLITGRTHQIRVHFSYLGHPLLGDQMYGGPTNLIDRQALHCFHFKFWDAINSQEIDLKAAVPEDISKLVEEGR